MENDAKKKRPEQVREQPMTYDDYARLPDEGVRYELADGVLEAMSPGPNARHQFIGVTITHRLIQTCSNDYAILTAPIDVILSEREVRQPDIVMIHRSRLSIITRRGIEGAPDLVVEVLSPHSVKRDRKAKLRVYAKYGIPEYWIVDYNNECLEQYTLGAADDADSRRYELLNVYLGDEPVSSERLPCVSFTMQAILDSLPHLPNF